MHINTCNWLEYLLWSLEKCFIRLQLIKIFKTVQKSNNKIILRPTLKNCSFPITCIAKKKRSQNPCNFEKVYYFVFQSLDSQNKISIVL